MRVDREAARAGQDAQQRQSFIGRIDKIKRKPTGADTQKLSHETAACEEQATSSPKTYFILHVVVILEMFFLL